jgi:hypothetical protein
MFAIMRKDKCLKDRTWKIKSINIKGVLWKSRLKV